MRILLIIGAVLLLAREYTRRHQLAHQKLERKEARQKLAAYLRQNAVPQTEINETLNYILPAL